jgi:CRP/FNR family transcriptional regulator, anaerobic regulatory protein
MNMWAGAALPGLPARTIAQLNALPRHALPTGQTLFRAGDSAQGFAVVLSGRVELRLTGASGREILLYAIEPGQTCIQTTLGLMGGAPYTADAMTTCATEMVVIPAPMFHDLMQDAPFRAHVFRAFGARMAEVTALLEQIAFAPIEARLARALLDMCDGGVVQATHADLAARIGSAREVVSRQLERWSALGLVRTERGRILCNDLDGLRGRAE